MGKKICTMMRKRCSFKSFLIGTHTFPHFSYTFFVYIYTMFYLKIQARHEYSQFSLIRLIISYNLLMYLLKFSRLKRTKLFTMFQIWLFFGQRASYKYASNYICLKFYVYGSGEKHTAQRFYSLF